MDFVIDTLGSNEDGEQLTPYPTTSTSQIPKESKDIEESNKYHPLFHLFDEIEAGSTKNVKKKQKIPLAEKLRTQGLSSIVKAKLRGVSDYEKRKQNIDKLLAKSSVLSPGFENQFSIGNLNISDKKIREQRRKDRERTKGSKWFGLPATEMTDEVKRELELLQMRSVLDPKHFYKKNDNKVLPKYFQIGKVLDSPLDFYNNRLTKKERKKGLVEELLADAQFNKYNKMKYSEIITEKQKTHYKAWRQAKKLKKKKQ